MTRRYSSRTALFLIITISCLIWQVGARAQTETQGGSLAFSIERKLETLVADPRRLRTLPHAPVLQAFYAARAFRPAWVRPAGPTDAAREVFDRLARAGEDGLEPADYDLKELAAVIDAPEIDGLADFELVLSNAVIAYGGDAQAGRVAPVDVEGTFLAPKTRNALAILSETVEAPSPAELLRGLTPQSREYKRLRETLASFRARAAKGGWRTLPPGPVLRAGMAGPDIRALRQRLIDSGDLAPRDAEPIGDIFDTETEIAVRRFQLRHGLDVDGAVGRSTRARLDVPIENRIAQIVLNMERRRWMADDPGETYVFVNLANFELKVVDGAKTIHADRVIVGTRYNKSPVFSDQMSYLELNPAWRIPPSIAKSEILPKLRADPKYLADRNIRLFASWAADAKPVEPSTIDWKQVTPRTFGYQLRQEPGPTNALGRIKFMFPNRFNIYLHDTPNRSLFGKTVRSFSHGCIRVRDPVKLAEVILRDDPEWAGRSIDEVITTGKPRIIRLRNKVPIHLTYLTAWANKDGTVHFRDDIYDRDRALALALKAKRKAR